MRETISQGEHRAEAGPLVEAELGDFWALMKPRIMQVVVFTAFVGMVVAPGGVHPVLGFAALLCIAVGAGASGALNMWWDADIDRQMSRTQGRPIPRGRLSADDALWLGTALGATSVVFIGLIANWLAAGLLALTILYYLVLYTMWLKRLTPLNIVIGGAAGAFPPMIGWAVVTGGIAIEPLIMFAIIFLWTPPHSWALALFRNDDYTRVGVPMLPVVAGERETRRQIWLYSLALTAAALAPLATSLSGPIYAAVGLGASGALLLGAWRLRGRSEATAKADEYQAEKKFFVFTIFYLLALFAALLADAGLRAIGLDLDLHQAVAGVGA
ncbi:MAG: heme o synthase [Pseudomonadota bacterium]